MVSDNIITENKIGGWHFFSFLVFFRPGKRTSDLTRIVFDSPGKNISKTCLCLNAACNGLKAGDIFTSKGLPSLHFNKILLTCN